jgi:hypothetical protein
MRLGSTGTLALIPEPFGPAFGLFHFLDELGETVRSCLRSGDLGWTREALEVEDQHARPRMTTFDLILLFGFASRWLLRAPEAHATRLGPIAALAGAGADRRPLKLGEPAQDGKYELAVRRRGVGPRVLEL